MPEIAETLDDILNPNDCPVNVVTTARGLIRKRDGAVADCAVAYKPGPGMLLIAVLRAQEGGRWRHTMGVVGGSGYDLLLDALESITGTRDYR